MPDGVSGPTTVTGNRDIAQRLTFFDAEVLAQSAVGVDLRVATQLPSRPWCVS